MLGSEELGGLNPPKINSNTEHTIMIHQVGGESFRFKRPTTGRERNDQMDCWSEVQINKIFFSPKFFFLWSRQ